MRVGTVGTTELIKEHDAPVRLLCTPRNDVYGKFTALHRHEKHQRASSGAPALHRRVAASHVRVCYIVKFCV